MTDHDQCDALSLRQRQGCLRPEQTFFVAGFDDSHTNNPNTGRLPVDGGASWPSELDLMARLAGLRLQQRWSSWQRLPFAAESVKHISVYGSAI
jgi:hypothetical protein